MSEHLLRKKIEEEDSRGCPTCGGAIVSGKGHATSDRESGAIIYKLAFISYQCVSGHRWIVDAEEREN